MTTDTDWLGGYDHIADVDEATDAALGDLGRLSAIARERLFPIVRTALSHHRRATGRDIERRSPLRQVFDGPTPLELRRERLESTFPIGDGRRIAWSTATVDDHRARIEYLREHIAGVEHTIREHETAIDLITAAGVTCLAEIESVA